MTIEGKRICLRPIEETDAPKLKSAINASIQDFLKTQVFLHRPTTLKEQQVFVDFAVRKMLSNEAFFYGIILKDENELIGLVNTHAIDWKNEKTEIGYWVASAFTRQGLATEASLLMLEFLLMECKLHRITASFTPENLASERLLCKLGFRFEGVLLDAARIQGRWKNLNLYALLAEDYKRSRRQLFQTVLDGAYPKIRF
ncbi:GCN5-related N-acetyltransferase [Chloroherpeton thalassium ATCC 35110]|uniref:GCN5-related N-acetyltransferase n=1 Tax=Chloroherpeton thalassium (strain ATCC 35110 / GB-78) TaxID=517418 RepID=B3QV80_CHLT3|nr:GNAT family protein [Chloroherpeton thalassium]ACF13034.1 GCN5-related N-acetyltransferase [Chloroherpeton thalassium ATCC 35110]